MTKNIMTCYMIRHGKTCGNQQKRYIGKATDEPLSREGRQELFLLKKKYPKELAVLFDRDITIFSSPLKRAQESAKLLFPIAGLVLEPGLSEMDFGIFEGKNYQELSGDPRYQAWISSFCRDKIPEGESMEEFKGRSFQAFSSCLLGRRDPALLTQDPMIFLCHGGTIMSVLSHLTGEDYYSFQVANADGYRIEIGVNEDELTAISYHRLLDRISS